MKQNNYWGHGKWYAASPLQKVGWIFGGIVLAVLLAFIFGYFVMLLWNWIMPLLFGLPEIDYWLAFGIIILSRLIFGGFGHGHNHKCREARDYKPHRRPGFAFGKPSAETFKKWEHYEAFWKEEGEEAFKNYMHRKTIHAENEKPAE